MKGVDAASGVNIISATNEDEWFQSEHGQDQGTWTVNNDKLTVDSLGGKYSLEGATYLTEKGSALGSYEFETNIKITELNDKVQNPMVGIIPWYVDDDNYIYVQIKFVKISTLLAFEIDSFALTEDEEEDGLKVGPAK